MSVSVIPTPEDETLVHQAAQIIARNIVDSKKRKNKTAPSEIDLAEAITDIQVNPTMKGAAALTVQIQDDDFAILDSGVFDLDENSQIDPIDLNYPVGSRYWWRLTQVSPKADRSMQLTFMTREAVYLMHLFGPVKGDRASMTRAEFIKSLCDRVKEGKIELISRELHVKQPISAVDASQLSSGGSGAATGGSTGLGAAAAGVSSTAASSSQAVLVTASQESDNLASNSGPGAYGLPLDGYSELMNNTGLGGLPGGTELYIQNPANGKTVLARKVDNGAGSSFNPVMGLYPRVTSALGLSGGEYHVKIWRKDGQPLHVASGSATTASGALVAGPGGAASSTVTTIQAYYFEVNPGEAFYDAIIRLAQEVNWEFWLDGNQAHYDSETELIKVSPALTVARDSDPVVDWSYDWDARAIVTQFTLTLESRMFDFMPGQVILLHQFGPASTASTAQPKRPGRWLISEYTRNKGGVTSQFTLKQPEKPKSEPAPQISTSTVAGAGPGSSATPVGGVINPVPGASIGRLDMGIDGSGGRIVAPYDGVVTDSPRGWPNGGGYFYIVNDNQSGPDYTKAMYFAEHMYPSVSSGTHVKQGQQIGTTGSGSWEFGPAAASISYDPLAKTYGLGSGAARSVVLSFYNWLRSAGLPPTDNPSNAGNA